ncbi:MAG: FAD:protein FMN transferase [Oscillospiraceae bacterium]|nr:FAD:protein FMN transferase [Oscillospiraceae bacterium]MDD4413422.1 FAD:protein FMN transferase [Oscillospiraceae bacterium]
MKRTISLLLILVLVVNLTACKSKSRYEGQFLQLFDTMSTIVSYMDSKDEFSKFSTMIHDTLKEYHQLYDIYNEYDGINNIKTINDSAGKSPVKVDKRIIDLINFSKEIYTQTNGKCNIAMGSVLKIWHQYRKSGIDDPEKAALPSKSELTAAARHTNISDIIIDQEASTVYLPDPEMSLDVGAVAKGYATEQAAKKAVALGYKSALLSIGGNVRAVGSKNGDSFWKVGVQNPDIESDDLLTVEIKDMSVVTSGIYERYYTVDGKNYHHIIDTDTLMPADYFKAVTIICRDSGIADGLSTAVFCLPYEQGLELIDGIPDTEAMWVMNDGSIKTSENFNRYVKVTSNNPF